MDATLKARSLTALSAARGQLLAELKTEGGWEGCLSSSALSTAVAILALARTDEQAHHGLIQNGLRWLAANLNPDGGCGDAPNSPSNLSTTLLCWSAFSQASPGFFADIVARTEAWLRFRLGNLEAASVKHAVLNCYGNDRTFSAPILTVCALAGRLGPAAQAWPLVPQLPFELALFPHRVFKWLRLPVVSYAIPALIAIGLVRHHYARRRWSVLGALRERIKLRVLDILQRMQPESGGFLEATPLTGFVALSLAAAGFGDHPVTQKCAQFLRRSARPDGSWPIDTHLATWVTTLAINNLVNDENPLSAVQRRSLRQWLLDQQHLREHPFTHAAPGGWAWTPLSGGVPDADDTAGVLLALKRLGAVDPDTAAAASAGLRWLLDLQNRDGGIPTFCRGWGKLPFDRSCPDITAHALRAFMEWRDEVDEPLRRRLDTALKRGIEYVIEQQTASGAWIPLWFGNQAATDHLNPTYGTAQVIQALHALKTDHPEAVQTALAKGCQWLLTAQNPDGGWGGDNRVPSSIEETALAVAALAEAGVKEESAIERGVQWLLGHTKDGTAWPPAPIGLYFASLWYHEKLYPLIFTVRALNRAQNTL